MINRVVYEHINYFKDFDASRSFPFKNWPETNKVKGGLWGCRVGCSYGWIAFSKDYKKWIEEDPEKPTRAGEYEKSFFREKSAEECTKFKFVLKPWANNYIVTTFEDYQKLPKMVVNEKEAIDYEKCLADGIDAIELCSIGDDKL